MAWSNSSFLSNARNSIPPVGNRLPWSEALFSDRVRLFGSAESTMNLLVLDTSTDRTIVGVSTAEGLQAVASLDAARRHGRELVCLVRDALREVRLTLGELELIAVGLGPG